MRTKRSLTSVAQKLSECIPDLAQKYRFDVTTTFMRLRQQYGVSMEGIYNSPSASVWIGYVRPCCSQTKIAYNTYEWNLDREKLDRVATEYAEMTVAAWQKKIEDKLVDLEQPEVLSLGNLTFEITGKRNKQSVRIEQTIVFKYSKNGKPFNQFPARIYLNEKFIGESQYKKLMGIK